MPAAVGERLVEQQVGLLDIPAQERKPQSRSVEDVPESAHVHLIRAALQPIRLVIAAQVRVRERADQQ